MFVDVFGSSDEREWIQFKGRGVESISVERTVIMLIGDIYLNTFSESGEDVFMVINKYSIERYIVEKDVYVKIMDCIGIS